MMRSGPSASPLSDTAPALAVVAFTLGVVTLTLLASFLSGRPVGSDLVLHVGVSALLGVVVLGAARIAGEEARTLVTAVTVVGVMFFLYASLGRVAFAAIPWIGDPWLRAADRVLGLGAEPVLWVNRWLAAHAWSTEALSVFYGAFIPYIYLTIFLGLVARPRESRRVFILAFAILYGVSFMGYLFVPARGPVVFMEDAFASPLQGGFFHGIILTSIEGVGGPHGAFPSLHVGASVLGMAFDFRHGDRLRGLIYVPLVLLISLATLALRYHYLVDLVFGAAFAFGALVLAERWTARRVETGRAP
ncbi:MAG: phosphatase PAP2 family protein [Gemmatimonadota bacterium]|nr:phosphatase PAP2 family protein [Gemmatimonadota bacterium]